MPPSDRSSAASPYGPGSTVGTAALDGSVALALLSASESAMNPGMLDFAEVPLGALLGGMLGVLLAGVHRVLERLPERARLPSWCIAGAALGVVPAAGIGAFEKLHGPHHAMALGTLVATPLSGAAVGVLLSFSAPARGDAASRPRTIRAVVLVAAALLAALATELADESLLVLRNYPPLRTAMFACACLLTASAGAAVGSAIRAGRRAPAQRLASATWAVLVLAGVAWDAELSDARAAPLLFRPLAGRLFQLARVATDVDGDGSSSLFGGLDCGPFDPKVNPHAREIPGNGVDDNCRWGDARPKALPRAPEAAPATPPAVDVVLITIDTLRADHVGSYGYTRATTPNIDAFGKTALRFSRAYTSGGWTCIAVQSMLNGLYARQLDWQPVAITRREHLVAYPWREHLEPGDEQLTTLSAPAHSPVAPFPVRLRARGVRTAAAVASLPAKVLNFDHFLEKTFERAVFVSRESDDAVVDAALDELSAMGDVPFFLWVHLFEPHEPYVRHPGLPVFGDSLPDVYDHDVAFADQQVGRLLAALDARRGRPVAIVLGSDHGETFVGGMPVHGEDLQDDAIRIPLFARGPGITPGVSDADVSLVDIAKTVLEWTATPASDLDGESLLHPAPGRTVLTDIWRHDNDGKLFINLVGATSGDVRLVNDLLNETWTMYDAGNVARPPRPLEVPIDERLRAAIGSYLEQTGVFF